MIKNKIITLLLILVSLYIFTDQSYANSIIYNIINNEKRYKSQSNIIYDIIDMKNKPLQILDKYDIEHKENKNMNAYIKGVDISKWNGEINWKALKKAGIKFVILRAGFGEKPNSDESFHRNMQDAIDNGIKILGVYWFSYSYNEDMAKKEALACLQTIKKYKKYINLPVFYDFEYDSIKYANRKGVSITKDKASRFADIFCKTIENAGYSAGIYTNLDYSNRYFDKKILNKYNVWIAQWSHKNSYKDEYIIWQRSDKYRINNKNFDLNYLYYNRWFK